MSRREFQNLLRECRCIQTGDPDEFTVHDLAEVQKTIMLVSVTERTQVIGLRLAIGARGTDIRTQFLVEAAVLAVLGGALGVAFGLLGGYAATYAFSLPFAVEPLLIAVAFVFCAGVGVVFGFYPAHRAAQLDPIEALRHE